MASDVSEYNIAVHLTSSHTRHHQKGTLDPICEHVPSSELEAEDMLGISMSKYPESKAILAGRPMETLYMK
jgi:hypothetical protein